MCRYSHPLPRLLLWPVRLPVIRCPTPSMRPSFFDVEMDHLARLRALVADRLGLRIKRGQLPKTEPAQHRADGRAGQVEFTRDLWAGFALPPQPLDRRDAIGVGAVRASGGRRAAVLKGKLAARPMPRQPTKRASFRDAGADRGVPHPPAFALHP